MKPNEHVDLSKACAHVTAEMPRQVHRPTPGCKECLETGGRWVHCYPDDQFLSQG